MCRRLEVKSETTEMEGSHLTWTLGFVLSEMGAAGGFAMMDQILLVVEMPCHFPMNSDCLVLPVLPPCWRAVL